MVTSDGDTSFEQYTEPAAESPTLIEGLPGHGLVASIAVDQIRKQLDLTHYGSIWSDDFPPVVTFQDGLVRDLVRVYDGTDPDVMTLQSDLALPPTAFRTLAECVLTKLAPKFDRGIFLAGAPAESEDQVGKVTAVATTETVRDEITSVGIQLADEPGLVGGITGALVKECYHADVPAGVLIVRAHPFLPDPGAAQDLIENALEPLVKFDIDTTELREQADEIQEQMAQVAQQYQQMSQEAQPQEKQPVPGMYQ